MRKFAGEPDAPLPIHPVEKNAFRKVQSLRRSPPHRFCAVGPGGRVEVFGVAVDERGVVQLTHLDAAALRFEQFRSIVTHNSE
jgi:hypothetical protein